MAYYIILRYSLYHIFFEDDLERVTGQHAQLCGHTNQKQKIKYTMKLKEETMP